MPRASSYAKQKAARLAAQAVEEQEEARMAEVATAQQLHDRDEVVSHYPAWMREPDRAPQRSPENEWERWQRIRHPRMLIVVE